MKLLKVLLIIIINISMLFFIYAKMYEYGWNAKDHGLYVVRLEERERNGEVNPLIKGLSIKEHNELADLNEDKFTFFKWCMILLIPTELLLFKGYKMYKYRSITPARRSL